MVIGPGEMGMTNALGSRRMYSAGSMTRPDHPCTWLWGHSSCLRALMICLQRARTFAKSGLGETEGEFFRHSATTLMVMS